MKTILCVFAIIFATSVDASFLGGPHVGGHLGGGVVAVAPAGVVAAGVISPGGVVHSEATGSALTLTHNAALVGPSAVSVDYTPIHVPLVYHLGHGHGLHHAW